MSEKKQGVPMFNVGDVVTVVNGESPVAVLTVAMVGKRVTLSDRSTWFLRAHSARWCRYGADHYFMTIRPTEPGDREAIAAARAEEHAKREHERLTIRLAGLGWEEVRSLPTDALRRMVAILDEAKAAPAKEPG